MFGIDFEALLLLAVLAFILFGPQKLPEYAAKLGCLIAKLKEATTELNQQCQTSFPNILERPAVKPPEIEPYHQEAHEALPVQPATDEAIPEVTAQAGPYEHPCPLCAHLVSHDFTFCPKCGHQVKPHDVSHLHVPEAAVKASKPS